MKPEPIFSVIIPTYNRADFISKTIQSLLDQTFENYEIIVVDDGSTDNTSEVVKNFKDKRVLYFKKENAERGAARNYGAKKANGKYLNFFDSDDLALRNHIQIAHETVKKNNYPEIFILGYEILNPLNNSTSKPTEYKNINKQLIHGNLISCNSVFIRNEIFDKFKFSENRVISASEDYLLWLQIASQHKFNYSNIVTSQIIAHDNRSVLNINPSQLISRKEAMLKAALNDKAIISYYGPKIKYLKENTYSYIALHLILSKHKKLGIKYFFKAVIARPSFIFSRRTLAIIKHIIL